MTAKIDTEACTGCGACSDICPMEAITIENGVAAVDEDACEGCGVCARECPNGAISME
ncbi:MAG TPA: 4Fe-4S binding protein [Planctomycetota bacterium]|nr:4Fe-4S binding protein [Planctomycetota bacterium]